MIVVNWRREILQLLVIVMDICWLAPLATVVSGLLGHGPIPAVALFALYIAAFWAGRLLDRLALDRTRARILVLYLAATSVLVVEKILHYPSYAWLDAGWLLRLATDLIQMSRVTPPAALTLVCSIGLWWAGLRLNSRQAARAVVAAHFSVGLAIFAFVLVLGTIRDLPDPTGGIFAFFFCGLMSVALSRLEDLPSGQAPASTRYWLMVLIIAIAVVLGGSALLVGILAAVGGAGESALGALTGLTGLIGQIIMLLLTPFGYLVYWLVMLLEWLRGDVIRAPDPSFSAPAQPLDRSDTAPTQLPVIVEQVLRVMPLVLFLILAGWLVTRALSRRRERAEDAGGEYRESIGGLGSLWGDIAGFLGGLWARLSSQARQQLNALASSTAPEAGAALSVRQVYARLLRLGARLGSPRRADQTPLEFLPDLERALPGTGGDPGDVTAAYVRARYGARPPSSDEAQSVRAAWERIQHNAGSRRT